MFNVDDSLGLSEFEMAVTPQPHITIGYHRDECSQYYTGVNK